MQKRVIIVIAVLLSVAIAFMAFDRHEKNIAKERHEAFAKKYYK
jgi:hypothetical protein